METKYGQLPDEMLIVYVNGMTSKIFKMLPMKQGNFNTLPKYIESTLREFVGQKELIYELRNNEDFLTVIGVIESLIIQDDVAKFRSDIFKALNLIKRLKDSLGGGER
jgi:hypothetical protein